MADVVLWAYNEAAVEALARLLVVPDDGFDPWADPTASESAEWFAEYRATAERILAHGYVAPDDVARLVAAAREAGQ